MHSACQSGVAFAQVNYLSHWLLAHELLLAPNQQQVSIMCATQLWYTLDGCWQPGTIACIDLLDPCTIRQTTRLTLRYAHPAQIAAWHSGADGDFAHTSRWQAEF